MYPLEFGNSSLMVSVPLQDLGEACEYLDGFFRSIGYHGIFSAEFKKDQRDGVFRILEINARPWWFTEFAARCGVDVVTMAYKVALGESVSPIRSYKTGQTLIHPFYDLQACLAIGPNLPRAIGRFLSPLLKAGQPVFSWEDPLPAFRVMKTLARGLVRRSLNRLR
ncbi:unnamed protein product [marine sediment metagenome]|uniref:ATP-grasp domain-containing protein n=1 Tax=marine sediment metagenome TaxID=412755 RepID=X1B6N2_9ZZZZ